jgi:hypothetical protein
MNNILNVERQQGDTPPTPPDEGEIGFVIQVGPRVYGGGEGLFGTDDDAHAAAIARGFADFNIKPVLPL